ncbi:MAG: DUF1788 domain-containing protein [Planctomycetes bacterium]|nr:DUF1788 domain-containing protein [Planctomycetota bacterium]
MNTEKLFELLSNDKFLRMEGLGNEVPFFVYAYDIKHQSEIYKRLDSLDKRLNVSGIEVCLVGLYDMVINHFEKSGELEELFRYEKEVSKDEFLEEMQSYLSIDSVIKPHFKTMLSRKSYRLVFVYQVGEVFPFLRSHILLNNLQSVVTDMPMVLFFPGEYVTSYEHGFKLNLFGKFEGPYYRAFKLEDYVVRGNI